MKHYDSQYMIEQYVKNDRSASDIARELGCNERTVSNRLRKSGVPTKRRIKQDLKQDLTGLISGRLKVLCLDKIGSSGNYLWKCKCKCGTVKTVEARSLLRKGAPVKSCGCARRSNCNWESVPPYILSTVKSKASVRGIKYNITLEYCDRLFKKQNGRCALSGLPIVFGRRRDTKTTTASLDRIDSSLPYEKGNIQWVHKKINIMKNNSSDEDFIEMCNFVSKHFERAK